MTPEELKKHRERLKFSQEELGQMAGVTDQTISDWERGVRDIPRDKINVIYMALGLSQTDDHIGSRIQHLIDLTQMSVGAFEDKCKLNRYTLGASLRKQNKPACLAIEKILAAFPLVSAEWLMRNEGPVYRDKFRNVDIMEMFITMVAEEVKKRS